MLRELAQKHVLLAVVSVTVYVGGVLGYTVWNMHRARVQLLATIDAHLLLVARALKFTLADDFHDRALDENSIALWEIDRNREVITAFANETEFTYLYTVVEHDGKYYFSAPTVTAEELRQRRSWYFYPYEDIPAEFVEALRTGRPVFVDYKDQWGQFRSVALPQTSPAGRHYLACADLEISHLHTQMRAAALESVATGVGFLLLSVPGLLLYRRSKRDFTAQLERSNQALLTQQEHLEEVVESRTRDLHQAKERAEEANHLKSVFLNNVSHEMRTPLQAIMNYAELAARIDDPVRLHQFCEAVEGQARHLAGLINDLLDHARMAAGKVVLEPASLDLPCFLEDALAPAGLQAAAKGLDFKLKIEPDLPTWVLADQLRLRQVILNLVNNAIKFTDQGGVVVEARVVDRDETEATILWSVTDTGPGIPPDELDNIFERFAQVQRPGDPKCTGLGLGTTIAKQLVEQMGGKIGVQSPLDNGGCCFWFEIRLPLDQAPLPHEPLVATASHLGGRVLVADDYELNRQVLRLQLELAGLEVYEAANGREVLEMCGQRSFDLIFMDVNMPEMNGLEATRALRASCGPGAGATVVALTASADPETMAACLASGAVEVLVKPVGRQRLLATVARRLDQALPPTAGTCPPPPDPNAPVPYREKEIFDPERALREFANQKDLLVRVTQEFLAKSRAELTAMADHLAHGRPEELRDHAHGLKGGAANLTAQVMAKQAGRLEQAAREGRLTECGALLDGLSQAQGLLEKVVNRWLDLP